MQSEECKTRCPSCRKRSTDRGTRLVFLCCMDEQHCPGDDRSVELNKLRDALMSSRKQLHEQSQRIETLERSNEELGLENKQLRQSRSIAKDREGPHTAKVSLNSALAAINAATEETKGESEKVQKRARN